MLRTFQDIYKADIIQVFKDKCWCLNEKEQDEDHIIVDSDEDN